MGTPPIALDIKPPAPSSGPLDQYQQGMSVQTLINQSKLQQQQQQSNAIAQQSNQIKLDQQKQAYQDQQTIREMAPKFSSKDANGNGTFDFEGLANAAQARGVNPQTINQMRMQNYQMQDAASKAGTEKLANEQGHNKAAYEVIEGVKGVTDPDERQTAYSTGLNRLKILGMDTSHLPAQAPNDDALGAYESSLGMHGQILADAKTLAETNEKNATASEKQWQKFPELGVMVNTQTGEQRSVTGGAIMTPAMMQSKYVGLQQKKNEGQPLSADDSAWTKGYEKYQTLKPAFQINAAVTGGGLGPSVGGPTPPALAGGPASPQFQQAIQQKAATAPGGWVSETSGKTLNDVPAAIRGEVQQVLEYRRADPSITQRGPVGQAINSWVAELDPKHDGTTYANRNKTLTDMQKDASSGQLQAVNTALGHLGELNTAAQALSQNNIPLLHSLAGKYDLATGGDAASTYQAILHRVGPEMTSAYVKSGGTEGERGSNEADFDIGKGAKQIQSNIAESAQLLNSKLASKKQAWDTGFRPERPQDEFDTRFLTPDAKATLQTLSAQAPTNKARHTAGGSSQGLKEGATGKGSDGKPYIVKGGVWVAQ